MAAIKTKLVRVTLYIRKKEGLSQDEFNQYWSKVHGPLVKRMIEKHGILKYNQVRLQEHVTTAGS